MIIVREKYARKKMYYFYFYFLHNEKKSSSYPYYRYAKLLNWLEMGHLP